MSIADMKIRLSKRRFLDKADVESVYGEVVRVIGGTRFSNGAPVGPSNGLLDWRNFTPDAGIGLANRTENRAHYCAQLFYDRYDSTASKSVAIPLPWDNLGLIPEWEATIYAWTMTAGAISPGVNSGTATLERIRTGTATTVGAAATLTNVTADTAWVNQSALSVSLLPRDTLRLTFSFSTGALFFEDMVCCVWMTTRLAR